MTEVLFYFLKALLMGIIIAAPLGPIAMICVRKTLERGFAGTLSTGLGAALADGVYACIAAFGLSVLSNFLIGHANVIKIIGGFLLLYLAYKEARSDLASKDTAVKSENLLWLMVEVFFLTLTNPLTMVTFLAVFTGVADGHSIHISESIAMVTGVTSGSMLWSMFLGIVVIKLKRNLPNKWLRKVGCLAAITIGLFGTYMIVTGFWNLV